MKKLNSLFVMLLLAASAAFAQVPQAINFQAIARDINGEVMANTTIMIQLTILDGGATGTEVYREIRSLTTNGYGSFSFQIGVNPFMDDGDFSAINWASGEKFMKVDYDPTASLNFELTLGTIPFATVPYAFAAGAVSYIDLSGVQDGDVLLYNAATGKFEPGQITNGTVEWSNITNAPAIPADLADLTDNSSLLFSGNYADLSGKPDFTGWDTDASNDFSGDYNALTNKPTLNTANWDAAYTWGNHAGLYRANTWVPAWTDVTGKPTFATVATSGSYTDLSNKPANATTTAAGFMSAADKTKLDGVNGSETKLSAGTNVTVTGNGTTASPYVINVAGASLLPPTVTATSASSVTQTTATLNGTVNANNLTSTVVFEWGNTPAYGNTIVLGNYRGTNLQYVSTEFAGLSSGVTYHYRVRAENAVDASYSNDMQFTTQGSSISDIVINEIRNDNIGTDTDEYFEIKGTPGASLSNYTLIVIGDDSDGSSGIIESVTGLAGQTIPADGHFLCYKQSAATLYPGASIDFVDALMNLENSDNVTYLLVSGFTGANGDDLDIDDNGTLDITPWTAIIDGISLVEIFDVPAAGEYYYSTITIGPDGSFVPSHSFRNGSTGVWTIGVVGPADMLDTPGTSNTVLRSQK